MARLERAASTSQMWRPTNWATPGYLLVTIIARNSCDSKFFPVCGHLCGQSDFATRFCCRVKSRKLPCCKGFRALAVRIVDRQRNAPKAGALPTALHPVIELFYPAGRIHPNVACYQLHYTRIFCCGHYSTKLVRFKVFPVCGHLCGQSGFLARLCCLEKSRKRPCFKGFRALAVSIMDRQRIAPKASALPTALIPDMKFRLIRRPDVLTQECVCKWLRHRT